MSNKYFYTITIVLILTSIFIINMNKDRRHKYDIFLANEYEKSVVINKIDSLLLKPNNPGLANIQNYYMLIDPVEKRVPTERLNKAYQIVNSKKEISKILSRDEMNWNKIESSMGGRTRGIMWDPNTNNKTWACSVSGGLYYNNNITDDDSNWNIVDDFWPGLSTNCIAYDPNNKKTFYVGTGEYHTARNTYRESSGVGYGIWKSRDAGETWTIIESTKKFKYISDLKVRDENGKSVIYAGVVSGLYKGSIHESTPSEGLYRSIDNGQSWEQVLPLISESNTYFAPADIEIAADGKIFIGTLKNIDGKGGATILSSETGKKDSWKVFDEYNKIIINNPSFPIPGRVVLGAAPSDKNTIYALVGAGYLNESNFNLAKGNYILKSTDGGDSWTSKPLPQGNPNWASLSWHAFAVTVNPTDPENVFIGGLDLWKSINGGDNWAKTSLWYLMNNGGGDEYVHADQHSILYKPNSSKEAIFSTDGGVFYSSNADENIPIYLEKNNNLSSLQFYSCDLSPTQSNNIFVGGLQDNGSLLYKGQDFTINSMISGGDGAYCFFDKNQPEYMMTSVYFNRYYLFENEEHINSIGSFTGVFINPVDYDSKNNTLYSNACSFTGNRANQLLRISNIDEEPIDSFIDLGTDLNTYFSNIKVSPYSPGNNSTLFIGSQNGRLFKILDAQDSPITTEIGSVDFPEAYISSISIGGSEDTLLVTFSNYGVKSVWETYDGGNSWKDISYNLPDIPVRWSIYHPQNSKQILLATELGIWSKETQNSWKHLSSFPNVRVDMLKVRKSDNTVLAASHGQGLFWTTWDYTPLSTYEQQVEDISIYPNPSSGVFNISYKSENLASFNIYAINGKLIRKGSIEKSTRTKVNLTDLAKGVYILQIISSNHSYSKKIIIE